MASIETDVENLDGLLGDLEGAMSGTQAATVAFRQELEGMKVATAAAADEARTLGRNLSAGLKNALGDLVIDGANLSDVLGNLARSMANSAFRQAITPVTDAIGNGIGSLVSGMLAFEKGAAFSGGNVTAFAQGGVVDRPVNFPMRGGLGLMGEAGPEAIMPLARGADGKLGVRGGQTPVVNVTMHISTPDVAGFRRSQSQISAGLARVIARGQRNR